MAKYADKHAREKAEIDRAYRGIYASSKKKKKKPESPKKRIAIIVICAVMAVLIIAATIAGLYFLGDNDGIILQNVSVAGVDVGGMTQDEAVTAVRAATKNTFTKRSMVITVLDNTIELPASYVGGFDVEGAVKKAYHFGHIGFPATRSEEKRIAATKGYAVDLAPYLDLDSDAIMAKLKTLGSKYSSTLTQSTWEVVGTKPTAEQIQAGTNLQTLKVTLGMPEYGLDMDALYAAVLATYSKNEFALTHTCTTIPPDAIDLQAILDEYYTAPVDASLESYTGAVVPGTFGYGFEIEKAEKALSAAQYGTVVEIPFERLTPELTEDNILDVLFADSLSTFTATANSSNNRKTNLRLACEAINGVVLNPGDVFSYNDTLGERTAANGYKPAASFMGGETVNTLGGGICQVSSCLYYSALLADLEILIRDNHGYTVAYMPLGMDATVSWNTVDFRFRNDADHPIRIEASANGGSTTVTICGIDDRDYYVKMECEIIDEIPSSTTYKKMPANNEGNYKNGDYIVSPLKGYDVKTYRCKYSKTDDTLISRDLEATFSYNKRDAVICEIEGAPPSSGPSQGVSGSGGGVTDSGGLPPE